MISILSKAATWSPEQPFGEAFSRVFSSRLCSAQLICTRLYVGNIGLGAVSVIDTATNTVVATVPVAGGPFDVAVHPDGARLYIANGASGTVSVIDTATNTVVATVPFAGWAFEVEVHPDGTRVYVLDTSFSPGGIFIIDTTTNIVSPVPDVFGAIGWAGLAINPDGTRLYATNTFVGVVVIDTTINATAGFVSLGPVSGAPGQGGSTSRRYAGLRHD